MAAFTIRKPQLLDEMNMAAYRPTAGKALLISLGIYVAYIRASLFAGFVYAIVLLSNIHYTSLTAMLNRLTSSQDLIIFSLYFTIALILLTLIYVRVFEKRPLRTLGLSRKRSALWYIIGFALAAAMLMLLNLPAIISGELSYRGFSWLIPVYLLAFVLQSASEEIFFRGYMMLTMANTKSVFFAVSISSAIFAFAHIPGGDVSMLDIITILMIGVFLALLTMRTNNLWASCGFHAAWNFTVGLLSQIKLGGFLANYAVFSADPQTASTDYGFIGDPSNLIYISIFLIFIALLLFAGKNRLVVRKPQQQPVPNQIA